MSTPQKQSNPSKPEALNPAIASLGVLSLAACGGGNPGATRPTSSESESEPELPWVPSGPPTLAEASAFLAQAGFGGTRQQIDEVVNLGFDGWIAKHLSMTSESHTAWLVNRGQTGNFPGETWRWSMWRKLLSAPDQLRQRMVLAWSQIFVVSHRGLWDQDWRNFVLSNYMDHLDAKAFGNFRDLLEAVTLSTAMGAYLNMRGNRKAEGVRVPDENFAREVMQLFTIGLYQLNPDGTPVIGSDGKPVATYDNDDVEGLAAALTGWNIATGVKDPGGKIPDAAYGHLLPMKLNPGLHSMTEKRFLGAVIPENTDGTTSLRIALDTLFKHPNVGPFIASRLIQRLVTSNPLPAYVRRVAAVFADNGEGVRGDMAAVVKAILLDAEARGQSRQPANVRGKLREPVLRFAQWARSFSAASTDGNWRVPFTWDETTLGQMPFGAPSVFNFYTPSFVPEGSALNSARLAAPEFQLVNHNSVVGFSNYLLSVIDGGFIFTNYLVERGMASNVDALVNHCSLLLTADTLSQETLNIISAAARTIPELRERSKAVIFLIMNSPEYLVQKT